MTKKADAMTFALDWTTITAACIEASALTYSQAAGGSPHALK
jgi:hypothetical protein